MSEEKKTPPAMASTHITRARARENALELLEGGHSARPRRTRGGLFQADWLDLTTGHKWRATRAELAEAYRLLAKHRDLWNDG
jgi:hypothetical protein